MSPRNYAPLSWTLLALIGLVSTLAAWSAFQLKFDYDFARFFTKNHPETEFYEFFQQEFGADSDYILIGLERSKGIFDSTFLAQVDGLSEELKGLPLVSQINSPTSVRYYLRDPLFKRLRGVPFLRWENPEFYSSDSSQIYDSPRLVGSYFAKDRNSLSILVQQQLGLDENGCACLNDSVQQILARYDFEAVHLAGRCIGQTYYNRLMQWEVMVFVGASIALVALLLFLVFKRWWGVVLPLMVVGLSVVWTLGLMQVNDRPLDVISNVIPSILLVIGLSSVIHILTHYLEEKQLKRTLWRVGRANLLTALTTAIGFLTLLTAHIPTVDSFALNATLGVLISFALTYLLLPPLLYLLKGWNWAQTSQGSTPDWLDHALRNCFSWLIRNRRSILWLSALVFIISLMGLNKLKVNNYLLEDLKADNPLQQDFKFYGEHYAGARAFELIFTPSTDKNWTKLESWQNLERLQLYLQTNYGVGQILSPLVFIKSLNQALSGNDPDFYRLPTEERELERLWNEVQRNNHRFSLDAYQSGPQFRVSGLMPDLGSQVVNQKNLALAKWFQTELGSSATFQLTGFPHLLDKSNQQVSSNVLEGLLIALLAIAMLMGALFRSLRMVVLALIPNLMPLLIIGGLMGWLGIDLKLSTSIVFTIAFGIAVDDTIHFMNRLSFELKAGKSLSLALKRSFLSTGKAILLTTAILVAGFMVLTSSEFLGTFYIGLLVSVTLVFAVLADMILLPVLLWYGWKS